MRIIYKKKTIIKEKVSIMHSEYELGFVYRRSQQGQTCDNHKCTKDGDGIPNIASTNKQTNQTKDDKSKFHNTHSL